MNDGYIWIWRDRIYQDAYDRILMMQEEFSKHYWIKFIDANGYEEEGADGGGLFKEFINEVLKSAMSDAYGFFLETPITWTYYPNPWSEEIPDYDSHFWLIGMIVGKALQKGILIPCEFSKFFLNLIVGVENTFNELKSLDKTLHDNLIFLKNYEGNVQDLSLTFSHEY